MLDAVFQFDIKSAAESRFCFSAFLLVFLFCCEIFNFDFLQIYHTSEYDDEGFRNCSAFSKVTLKSTEWAKKWSVLRVENFVTVRGRKACDMLQVSKFSTSFSWSLSKILG